jgi:hypothetical protein
VEKADNPDSARQQLPGAWTLELDSLLHKHPAEAGSVGALAAEILRGLPQAEQGGVQVQFVNAARDGGRANSGLNGRGLASPAS